MSFSNLTETEDAPGEGATPYKIDPGDSFAGRLIAGTDGADLLDIELEAGRNYRFFTSEMNEPSDLRNFRVKLFDPEGDLLASGRTGVGAGYSKPDRDPIAFSHFATQSGIYTIKISANRDRGNYQVNTDIDPNNEVDAEVPGGASTDIVLPTTSFFGSIAAPGDQDWFKVSLAANKKAIFSVAGPDLAPSENGVLQNSVSDLRLSLVSGDGKLLTSSFDLARPQFAYRPATDLDAFLVVSGNTESSQGFYELRNVWTSPFPSQSVGTISNDVFDFGKTRTKDIKLFLQSGDDTAYGGLGNDRITTGRGNDQVYGRGGNDHLVSQGGADKLIGGSGDDLFDVTGDSDSTVVVRGGTGRDTLDLNTGRVLFFGGEDDDLAIIRGGSSVKAKGGMGADDFVMRHSFLDYSASELVLGDFKIGVDTLTIDEMLFEGDDLGAYIRENAEIRARGLMIDLEFGSRIALRGISDLDGLIETGSVKVDVSGKTLFGGAGVDRIKTGVGDDVVKAGSGDDIVVSRTGADTLLGGPGEDLFVVRNSSDGVVTVKGEENRDKLKVFDGTVVFEGGAARDQTIVFGSSTVTATGGRKDDVFSMKFSGSDYSASNLTITDFETGSDWLKLDRQLLAGTDAEAYVRSNAEITTTGISLELEFGSRVVLNSLTDLNALMGDILFV